jgi:hypothetical protein
LKAIGRVGGLVTSDKEVHKLVMLDREAWRSSIKMIVAAGCSQIKSEVVSIKIKDRKTRCIKTRSAIVVI